jgi:putative Mg2+ transporter-C (MgtC) family protein
MPSEAELAGRIALAALLGGVVGLERELTDKAAGLRTYISVCLGAALFGIVSAYGFEAFEARRATTNFQVDVTRIASTIVTGVGFLGGGAILKHGASIRGLTTAASIWVVAAIGLAVGVGSYFVSLVTTAVLLLSLWGLRGPRRWLVQHAVNRQRVLIRLRAEDDLPSVVEALEQQEDAQVRSVTIRKIEGALVVQAELQCRASQLDECLGTLSRRPEVLDIDVGAE